LFHHYHSTVALHTHISSGRWTIGMLVATVQRHSLIPLTWTTSSAEIPWVEFRASKEDANQVSIHTQDNAHFCQFCLSCDRFNGVIYCSVTIACWSEIIPVFPYTVWFIHLQFHYCLLIECQWAGFHTQGNYTAYWLNPLNCCNEDYDVKEHENMPLDLYVWRHEVTIVQDQVYCKGPCVRTMYHTLKFRVFWDVAPCSLIATTRKTLNFILAAVRTWNLNNVSHFIWINGKGYLAL
jgi:hypothetical protein